MKNKEYIEDMKNVHASEELINETVNKIVENDRIEKNSIIKRIAIGMVATVIFSIGSVGAYVGITGNTEILKKIGINISDNYEKNKQIIENVEDNKNILKFEGAEAKLVSAAIDNSSIVLELDVNLNEKIECIEPDVILDDIKIYMPNKDFTESEYFKFEEYSNSSVMEDGTYKLFKYVSIQNLATGGSSPWLDIFDNEDKVNCTMIFKSLSEKESGKIIANIDEKQKELNFDLLKPQNLDYSEYEILENEKDYGNINIKIDTVQMSDFGNVISLRATQNDIKLDEINDIQKIKLNIKNSKGEDVKVISRNDSVTMDNYSKGQMNTVILEIQLKVDDKSSDLKYIVEPEITDKINVASKEIERVNKIILDEHRKGDVALTTDGISYPTNLLNSDEYYKDEFGIYRIDKDSSEL